MRVILTSDIDDIGLAGEVKNVKNGLARNYLIPQKLAIEATETNLRDWEKKLEALKQKREKTLADAREAAEKIDGTVINIESKISSGEKMFGSVNVQTIVDALKEQHGLEIEKKNVLLEKNIKSIGKHEVPVRIKAQIKASIIVEIEGDEEEEMAAEAAEGAVQETEQMETEQTEAAEQTETEQQETAPAETEQTEEKETGGAETAEAADDEDSGDGGEKTAPESEGGEEEQQSGGEEEDTKQEG
ncbi:MAG: 50S ribosomal protein L9 [Thermodesulfobacteriota bacterium]